MWEFNFTIFFLILFTFICLWIIARLLIDTDVVYVQKGRKRHNWKQIKILNRVRFCL